MQGSGLSIRGRVEEMGGRNEHQLLQLLPCLISRGAPLSHPGRRPADALGVSRRAARRTQRSCFGFRSSLGMYLPNPFSWKRVGDIHYTPTFKLYQFQLSSMIIMIQGPFRPSTVHTSKNHHGQGPCLERSGRSRGSRKTHGNGYNNFKKHLYYKILYIKHLFNVVVCDTCW